MLRLLPAPRLERLEVLEIFSLLFRFVRGLHIQPSTSTPTITPITMPAMDPLSRPVFPVIVVEEPLVTVVTAAVVVTVAGVDAPPAAAAAVATDRDVTIVAAAVAPAPPH